MERRELEVNRLQGCLQDQQTQLDDLVAKHTLLTGELDTAERKVSESTAAHEQDQLRWDSLLHDADERASRLTESIEAAERLAAARHSELDVALQDAEHLRRQISELEAQSAIMASSLRPAEAAGGYRAPDEEAKKPTSPEKDQAALLVSRLRSERDSFADQLQFLRAEHDILVCSYERQLEELRTVRSDLSERLSSSQQDLDESSAAQAKLAIALSDTQRSLSHTSKQASTWRDQLSLQQKDANTARERADRLVEEIAANNSTEVMLRQQCKDLGERLSTANAALRQAEDEVQRLNVRKETHLLYDAQLINASLGARTCAQSRFDIYRKYRGAICYRVNKPTQA